MYVRLSLVGTLSAVVPLILGGCVERLLQIRSDPPGAEVFINGQAVQVERDGETVSATTPLDVEFDFYGSFEVQLRHPDREAEHRLVHLSAPIYAYPPLDLLVENLWPLTVRDHHLVEFTLKPAVDFDDESSSQAMVERMESLRTQLAGKEDRGESER